MNESAAFAYFADQLHCEKVNLAKIAKAVGTPFYVYSYTAILNNFREIRSLFSAVEPLIAFSVKSNANAAILRGLAREGAGFDVVSGGEIQRVLAAGGDPRKIVFAGVGKTDGEIELALRKKILMFNVESLAEAYLIDEIAGMENVTADVMLRINPDVDPKTHKYITTGTKENKFGIPWEECEEAVKEIAQLKNIQFRGLHMHIGSQILEPEGYILALDRLKMLVTSLRAQGLTVSYLNIGGGYGIAYRPDQKAFRMAALAPRVIAIVKELGCQLIMEPGRWIVAPAGALVTRITYLKPGVAKNFVIVDAAMTDLIRPALYGAHHEIVPVVQKSGSAEVVDHADVVGPVCESGDFLGQDRSFQGIKPGELLAVLDVGAYGYVMSSQYNSRPRAPEILVRNSRWFVVRERETIKDITRLERLPDFLK